MVSSGPLKTEGSFMSFQMKRISVDPWEVNPGYKNALTGMMIIRILESSS
jgi:hypothetical protein